MNISIEETEKSLKKIEAKFEVLGKNINEEFIEILVDKDDILDVLKALRKDMKLRIDNLHCMSGADYPPDYIEVVYHLYSYENGHKIVLKTRLNREKPEVKSAYSLWKTADWQEREIHELFGVNFIGHPNLRNILLSDDFPGHPFLKDAPLKNDEEWLLDDVHPPKDFGIPAELEQLYEERYMKNNGEKK